VDFAYKGPKRKGRGTGHKGLRSTLKYLQYRDNRTNHLVQAADEERWRDFGMGKHYREIFENCDQWQSKHVLAWTWVVPPPPDLMALVPEDKRPQLVCDLTERIVEDYYLERGFVLPEYSYVLHDRLTEAKEGEAPIQQFHTHVVLPVYNNKERRHDALFRDIATRHFSEMLDEIVGPEWRLQGEEEPEIEPDTPQPDDLESWFPHR